MSTRPLRIVVLGLSLSSSWGNGHATTYRALLRAMAERGHDILFLERDVPWYAAHRDLGDPEYCRLAFYSDLRDLHRYSKEVREADLVIVGSYVPDGIAAARWVFKTATGVTAFYDIDTPVTMAALQAGTCKYLSAAQVPLYHLYLSFTGGPKLRRLERDFRAKAARVLFCSVDTDSYAPRPTAKRWDLGYIGTYSADRQATLDRLLIEPARSAPDLRFVVVGPQYPDSIRWPTNVERISHLSPRDHCDFYSSLRWTLNVTREEMLRAGYSPSVRLFEAAACATPIISDSWPGLPSLFRSGDEIIIAKSPDDVTDTLRRPEAWRARIARAGRSRILHEHTSRHRARELELYVCDAIRSNAAALQSVTRAASAAAIVVAHHA